MLLLEYFTAQLLPNAAKIKMPLEIFLENNCHQGWKIAGKCFSCLHTRFLLKRDADRVPPSQYL